MAVRKMSNVAVAMSSIFAAAVTITAITKADPAVVTAAGHGYANGDFVALEIQGMQQLTDRVFRVSSVSTDTFQLEDTLNGAGVSTLGLDDFSSGTAKKPTFGHSVTSATTIDASGGDFDFIDTSLIHNNIKSQIPGSANPITKTLDLLWDVASPGQIALKNASEAQQLVAFKFTYGTGGPIEVFMGYVGFTGAPTGSAQDKITSPASITAFGAASYYSA